MCGLNVIFFFVINCVNFTLINPLSIHCTVGKIIFCENFLITDEVHYIIMIMEGFYSDAWATRGPSAIAGLEIRVI